ncbi:MAG: phosphoenolpyruvate--protein phosphotransferase [Lachnospiraceae bacterium]|nr:phosphoenolpyruvate--protein phosphotransferase [Lachnospiraceae bacterium]
METYKGKVIHSGNACGNIIIADKSVDYGVFFDTLAGEKSDKTAQEESEALSEGLKKAKDILEREYKSAKDRLSAENLEILRSRALILGDVSLNEKTKAYIEKEAFSASGAVAAAVRDMTESLKGADDEYIKLRIQDIYDVTGLLIECIRGNERVGAFKLDSPSLVLAHELMPSELIAFKKDMLKGIVTARGSEYSHTAILAGAYNVPYLVCPDIEGLIGEGIKDSEALLICGDEGILYIEPDDNAKKEFEKAQGLSEKNRALAEKIRDKEPITLDGTGIKLYANIAEAGEAELAKQNKAFGIGLFRTEFLLFRGNDFPTEEEQLNIYKNVAEIMEGREVNIRTFDVGADKCPPYMKRYDEKNPQLGIRGIRYGLKNEGILRTQLRAILRAAEYGNINILIPMVSAKGEVKRTRDILDEAKKELASEGKGCGNPYFGVMIETPAAALIADELLEIADFASVGTNDLTQYVLAWDRENNGYEMLDRGVHPSVKKLLKIIADAGTKSGKPVCICGELAADTAYTGELINMGYRSFSVSAGRLSTLKNKICSIGGTL